MTGLGNEDLQEMVTLLTPKSSDVKRQNSVSEKSEKENQATVSDRVQSEATKGKDGAGENEPGHMRSTSRTKPSPLKTNLGAKMNLA